MCYLEISEKEKEATNMDIQDDYKVAEFDRITHKLQTFGSAQVNANLHKTLEAMTTLTDVEFRMWVNNCQKYDNFDTSHFKGLEQAFITTGKWEGTCNLSCQGECLNE